MLSEATPSYQILLYSYSVVRLRARISRYELYISLLMSEGTLLGCCRMQMEAWAPKSGKVRLLLNRGLTVRRILVNGRDVEFRQGLSRFKDIPPLVVNEVIVQLEPDLPVSSATVVYGGKIEPYEHVFRYVKDRITQDFAMVRSDAFSYPLLSPPDFSELVRSVLSQTFEYVIRAVVPTGYTVANVGRLASKREVKGKSVWTYTSRAPSWRIDVAVAKYEVRRDEDLDITVFSFKEDVSHAGRLVREVKRALSLFSAEFGSPPDWRGYTIIEIPEGWGCQADVCGMLLSRKEFTRRDPVGVYHEIAHLWNVKTLEECPSRFLDEAFASYFQLLAEWKLLGRDLSTRLEHARRRFLEMCEKDRRLLEIAPADYGRHKLTDAMYYIGVWIMHLIHRILGDDTFRRAVREFIRRFRDGATLEDFVMVLSEFGGDSVRKLAGDWIFSAKGARMLAEGASIDEITRLYRC